MDFDEKQGDEPRTRYSGLPPPQVIKQSEYIYTIEPTGPMRVPVRIFTSDTLLPQLQSDDSLRQASNVATLPGLVKASIVMPDAHQGYGFSIGGVAAFDPENGIISPGGIGVDINCGVRLLTTNLKQEDVMPQMQDLINLLYKLCPVGTGGESRLRLTDEDIDDISVKGAHWAVERGIGNNDDLDHAEANAQLPEADPRAVTQRARTRGRDQLGTVGAGNHFVEIQFVEQVFDEAVASQFGLHKGQVVAMVHCGSRGFGHQTCTDYLRLMEDDQPDVVRNLPDRNLIYAPFASPIAKQYWGAMNAAANYAFCNRHILGSSVREAFRSVFGDEAEVKTMYDVCHNIAKMEEHTVDGVKRKLLVHRKGATRAFPAHHPDIPAAYREVGQPVIIPGSMGTASYVLVGAPKSMELSFGSTAHGAGRVMSRLRAKRDFPADMVKSQLSAQNITIKAASLKGISEEAPGAYKDVDEVIRVSHESGIAKKVARLKPIGVIKG
jgi:tRNA-splicing ligase RtcB (3'-phosphate/5'-hydroxy nucleic acid ligase)